MALASIGADPIDSITEPSNEAEKCKLFFDASLEFILSAYRWRFISRTQRLTVINQEEVVVDATKTPPTKQIKRPVDWSFMYAYPADALRIDGIIGGFSTPRERQDTSMEMLYNLYCKDYQIEYQLAQGKNDKVILCDYENAIVRYSHRIEDITQLSAPLVEALVAYLASKLALPLIGGREGRSYQQQAYNEYAIKIKTALTHDVSQQNRETRTTRAKGLVNGGIY